MSLPLQAGCDAASAHVGDASAAASHPTIVLLATTLASGLAFIDGSVVNVGLQAIGRDLAADTATLQWVVNAYLLPLSALLLLGGAAGDRYGRRRMLVAGTSLFALASLVCALAPGAGWLLAGRFLQGASAALLMPNSLAILGSTFSGEARGRAIGIWAASGAALGAIGPVLGGWLIDLGDWRSIFLLNLPIAAAAILLALLYVPRDRFDEERALDWAGGVLATLALGGLTLALTLGSGPGGWTIPVLATTVTALGLAGLFVAVERRRGEAAMMPLALFGSRTFVGLSLLTFLLYGALGGLFVVIPYVLIVGAGYSATAAGAALLPLPLVIALLSPLMGSLAVRVGPRLPLGSGPLVVGCGFLLALRIGLEAQYWTEVFPAIVTIALGMSAAVAPLTTAVLNAADSRYTGSASGFNSAVARTGGLFATALLGAVLAAEGSALFTAFHLAMTAGAVACAAAALSVFALVERTKIIQVRP